MSTPPTPYNITLLDTSPILLYSPSQDGPIDTSWNVTFSGSSDSSWVPQSFGVGTSSHRTRLAGASVRINWLGTAVYLYGTASDGAYTIILDGASTSMETKPPGLLFAKSGLTYGSHSLTLRVIQDTSITSISSAIITEGVGAVGSKIQTRTIDTTTVPPASNDIVLTGTWYSYYATYGIDGPFVPRLATNVKGSAISFSISSASAFYIMGHVNFDHGPYRVIFTVTPSSGQPHVAVYNGSSRWVGLDTIKYLATGLDRMQTYHVEVINESDLYYDQSKIIILDTPPSSSYQPPPSNPAWNSHTVNLPAAAIIGIVVGCLLLIILFFFLLWRKRQKPQTGDASPIQHDSSLPNPAVTSQSNHPTSVTLPPTSPEVQDGLSDQENPTSLELGPTTPAPPALPVDSPANPSTTGDFTPQDAQFFNNLYALNVPAAEIATMMESLRAEREAGNLNRTEESIRGSASV